MKKLVLQNIIFPEGDRFPLHHQLFYRENRLVSPDGKSILVPGFTLCDFATALNGFPLNKWRLYTGIGVPSLTLRVRGHVRVVLTGYKPDPVSAVRTSYLTREYDFPETEEITFSYPADCADDFLAFELEFLGDGAFHGGYYSCECEESAIRNVNLVISTTTFRKEEYIRRNIALIREHLLETDDPVRDHIFMNVVDNGRTLPEEEVASFHIRLFQNPNTGGAGGFARGMMEALAMPEGATHVLLMDDDVLLLPESIRRTYMLLSLVNDAYAEAFVSGAMMHLDEMAWMYEDIASVPVNMQFTRIKRPSDLSKLNNILYVNREQPEVQRTYAAWWYCVIPVPAIRKHGLPLPLFIRWDDIEYGIRCKPKIMSMTGICVWHLRFDVRFSAATAYYLGLRNAFIVWSVHHNTSLNMAACMRDHMMKCLLTYDYAGAELLLLAIEDFMRGPSLFDEDLSEQIMQRNRAIEEKPVPLSELPPLNVPLRILEGFCDGETTPPQGSFPARVRYYLTLNGQLHAPESWTRDDTGVIPSDYHHSPALTMWHRRLLAVNTYDRTGILRTQDRKRFMTLFKRYLKDMKQYGKNRTRLEREWCEAFEYLTGEKFWKRYLKLS